MKTKSKDQGTPVPWRFVIMSPSGAAKFLATDEADANDIVRRLNECDLKSEINHFEQAKDRDPHGVAVLVAMERDRHPSTIPSYRYNWVDGRALVSYRGCCIAEAIWVVGATDPKGEAIKNGKLITKCLNKFSQNVNEHAALVAVAEAAKALLAHHRISDLRKLNSDTLTPRFEALDAALRQQQGSEVAK